MASPTQTPRLWLPAAQRQAGVLSRRQLEAYGVSADHVRNQVRAARWQTIGPNVVCLTTGVPTPLQSRWAAILHAGDPAVLCGLTALEDAGLTGWSRPTVSVLVPKSEDPPVLTGARFVETRRDIVALSDPTTSPPRMEVDAAALLFAAYQQSERSAGGVLAAVVQQRLTTAERLAERLKTMTPLRRAPLFRLLLDDIGGGSHSMAEADLAALCREFGLQLPDRQTPRRDAGGKRRYTDSEWHLPGGRRVVLEVDGGFHTEVRSWWDDMVRERELVLDGSIVLRCSTFELRTDRGRIAHDLARAGVPRARPSADAS